MINYQIYFTGEYEPEYDSQSNLIGQVDMISNNLRAIDVTLGSYIEYKKDTKKFTTWLEKLNETTQKELEKEMTEEKK